jgi:hypothetical protein
MLRRLNRDEGGAVLVIVALSLIALFAMAVLSVDVGGLYAARRSMVNAADAAALAAAQTCITQDQDPQAVALSYAQDNVAAFGLQDLAVTAPVVCDYSTKTVTVAISAQQDLFFAPVLGFDDHGAVATTATAKWGPTGSASPIPLVIYEGLFQGHNCDVPNNIAKGTTCYLWEDNDLSGSGNFGFIDVGPGWNVGAGGKCNDAVGDPTLEGWINGDIPVSTLSVNYPNATYSCSATGNHSESQVYDAIRELTGQQRDFPIVGISPADNAAQQIGTGQNVKYNVLGFAHFIIEDVLKVKDAAPVSCKVTGFTASPADLMAMAQAQCGAPLNATFADNVKITPGNVQGAAVTSSGVLSWAGGQPSAVTFDYTMPSTSCGGQPAPNGSAHCLVLQWNGSTLDVDDSQNGGADFGIQGVNLIR